MLLSEAARVWNRAAMDEGGPAAREGDRMLASLLLVHGYVMNGGVLHALELEAADLQAGIQAYQYRSVRDVWTSYPLSPNIVRVSPELPHVVFEP